MRRTFLHAIIALSTLSGLAAGLGSALPFPHPSESVADVPGAASPVPAPVPLPQGPTPLDDPIQDLIELSIQGAPPIQQAAAFERYLEESGLIPGAEPLSGPNDETVEWTYRYYRAGDVTGDAIDELILDGTCVDRDGCTSDPNPLRNRCGLPKKLRVIDGATLEDVWMMPLNEPFGVRTGLEPPADEIPASSILGCINDFVLGAIPNDAGTFDVLVYEHIVSDVPYPGSIFHDYFLVDSATGNPLWHYTKGVPPGAPSTQEPGEGLEEAGFNYQHAAKNAFLVPLLQVPPDLGVHVLPPATKPGLIVRSIGWVMAGDSFDLPQVGYLGYVAYRGADEWAAGVDLVDGTELWKEDTFQPETDRFVLVFSHADPNSITSLPCCWDLNADGVPDAVFTTYEFYLTNLVKPPGALQGAATRLLALDGATGDVLYSFYPEPDHAELMFPASVAALGDVTGDGASDYALYTFYGDLQELILEETVTSVRQGPDHSELWSVREPVPLLLQPVGDIDGNGGNELITIRGNSLDTFVNYTRLDLSALQGNTGDTLWTRQTIVSGIDLAYGVGNLAASGLLDLDDDDVADFWLDDPEFLADQTVVHHVTWIAGRDGADLTATTTVGAFMVPTRADDLTGDGTDDYFLLQGDLVDVWGTAYDGTDSAPLWSRRLLSAPSSNAFLITPKMTTLPVELDGQPGNDLFAYSSLAVLDFGGRTDAGGGVYSQAYGLEGTKGRLLWGIPEYEEGDASLLVGEHSPATQRYFDALPEEAAKPAGYVASAEEEEVDTETPSGFPTGWVAFGGVTVVSLGAAYAIAGRKLRP